MHFLYQCSLMESHERVEGSTVEEPCIRRGTPKDCTTCAIVSAVERPVLNTWVVRWYTTRGVGTMARIDISQAIPGGDEAHSCMRAAKGKSRNGCGEGLHQGGRAELGVWHVCKRLQFLTFMDSLQVFVTDAPETQG